MKLKYKLETLDGLSDELKALYEEKDGVFILSTPEGMPEQEDVSGLKAKVQELLDEKKAEAEKARSAAEEARLAKEEKAKKEGDFKALSESYLQKIEGLEAQIEQGKKDADAKEISRQAMLIASDLAEGANQEILSTFIERRLRIEEGEVKVTDDKGNLTISTVDQLKEEFRGNPKFGALVIASKASGAGGDGKPNGGGASKNPWKKGEDFNLTEQGRITRENPQLAASLKKEAGY